MLPQCSAQQELVQQDRGLLVQGAHLQLLHTVQHHICCLDHKQVQRHCSSVLRQRLEACAWQQLSHAVQVLVLLWGKHFLNTVAVFWGMLAPVTTSTIRQQ
jgi:hypothetical protein